MKFGPLALLLSLTAIGCSGDTSADNPASSAGGAGAGGGSQAGAGQAGSSAGASGAAGQGGSGDAGGGQSGNGQAGSGQAGAGPGGSGDGGSGQAGGGQAGSGQAGQGDAGSGNAGNGGTSGAGGGSECAACGAYQDTVTSVPVPYAALVELSGLAASRAHPGVLYAHNDSGDTARFFAITTAGAAAGEFAAEGATATDWEDIAVGPCAAGTCVFVGDIGDNKKARSEYQIIRVTEPALPADPLAPVKVAFDRIRFVYPDGPHNAETLLVHPATGEVYVVTKGTESAVYRLPMPLDTAGLAEAIKIVDFANPKGVVTGGDIHPCGDRILIGTYSSVLEYRVPEGMPFESVFSASPIVMKQSPGELQSESFAYLLSGQGFVTSSEDPLQQKPVDLHLRGCQ